MKKLLILSLLILGNAVKAEECPKIVKQLAKQEGEFREREGARAWWLKFKEAQNCSLDVEVGFYQSPALWYLWFFSITPKEGESIFNYQNGKSVERSMPLEPDFKDEVAEHKAKGKFSIKEQCIEWQDEEVDLRNDKDELACFYMNPKTEED